MGGWGSLDDDEPDPLLVAGNARHQARVALRIIRRVTRGSEPFALTPSLVRGLHRIALDNIDPRAGQYRPDGLMLAGHHLPPPHTEVPALVERLCSDLAERWDEWTAPELAAFVLWRLCWIHPFADGNGRTARSVAYVVLSARFGFVLPGRVPIPMRIKQELPSYYGALRAADRAYDSGHVDVSELARVLRKHLRAQLAER